MACVATKSIKTTNSNEIRRRSRPRRASKTPPSRPMEATWKVSEYTKIVLAVIPEQSAPSLADRPKLVFSPNEHETA